MKFRTNKRLLNIIRKIKGACPLTLESRTCFIHNKKSKKTGKSFDKIFKSEVYSLKKEFVFIGADYEKAVNTQRKREKKSTNFKAFSLPWGKWLNNSKIIIVHHGKYFLRYYVDMSATYKYSKKSYQFENGKQLTSKQIKVFFNEFMSPRKKDSGRQKLDKSVQPRCICFDNILKMKFNKIILKRI
jgi:hypothetical protein